MTDIAKIWHDAAQGGPPVLVKRRKDDLFLRLTFAENNRRWIREAGKATWLLQWDKGHHCWMAPRSWFEALATLLLERHGHAWIIQEADSSPTPCNEACMHALGLDCVCGCGGKNHGLGEPDGWAHDVVDGDVAEWRGKRYTCRLLKPRDAALFGRRVDGAVADPPLGNSVF